MKNISAKKPPPTKNFTKKPALLKPRTFEVTITTRVRVTIQDPDVFTRCVENTTSKNGYGEDCAWRSQYCDLRTEQDVIEHLAFNRVINGVVRASQLVGWGDLEGKMSSLAQPERDVDFQDFEEVTS